MLTVHPGTAPLAKTARGVGQDIWTQFAKFSSNGPGRHKGLHTQLCPAPFAAELALVRPLFDGAKREREMLIICCVLGMPVDGQSVASLGDPQALVALSLYGMASLTCLLDFLHCIDQDSSSSVARLERGMAHPHLVGRPPAGPGCLAQTQYALSHPTCLHPHTFPWFTACLNLLFNRGREQKSIIIKSFASVFNLLTHGDGCQKLCSPASSHSQTWRTGLSALSFAFFRAPSEKKRERLLWRARTLSSLLNLEASEPISVVV